MLLSANIDSLLESLTGHVHMHDFTYWRIIRISSIRVSNSLSDRMTGIDGRRNLSLSMKPLTQVCSPFLSVPVDHLERLADYEDSLGNSRAP